MAQVTAKTVCVVARRQRPPEFVGTLRDKDTDTCRSFGASAAAAGIRYAGEEGWARVPMRLPLPRFETVERGQRRQIAATAKALECAAQGVGVLMHGRASCAMRRIIAAAMSDRGWPTQATHRCVPRLA